MKPKRKIRNPKTKAEWQAAADCAEFLLAADSCKQYGLITGGPAVNVDRCLEILEKAKAMGIVPAPDAIERYANAWQEQQSHG